MPATYMVQWELLHRFAHSEKDCEDVARNGFPKLPSNGDQHSA
jgi:hypothetical protein